MGAWPLGGAITFEIAVKAGAADAENVRGAQAVALAHVEHALDVDLADFFERERLPVVAGACACHLLVLHVFRKVAEIDEIAGGGDAGTRDDERCPARGGVAARLAPGAKGPESS